MVGLVVVSHTAQLAEGVVELAREMGGAEVRIEAAGGLDDGSIGTDAERVRGAIERAMSADGVLVLMDLGSALMSAEMATELLDVDAGRVVLSEAPIVEGAVAAAAAARAGGSLEEVQAEARGALRMKASQLGVEEEPAAPAAERPAEPAEDLLEARLPVLNAIGLHARPAARVVELATRFDAELRLAKAGGRGPVGARSLTGLMTLGARLDDELVATASGPQATEALDALDALARDGFGEGVAPARPAPAPVGEPARADTSAVAGPPPAGAVLHGIPAAAGVAIAPARHLGQGGEPPPAREAEEAAAEGRRLEAGRAGARQAIERDAARLEARGAEDEAAIFSAHVALLDDEALLAPAMAAIEAGTTAERAWYDAAHEAAEAYRTLDDPLLRERAIDVEDVGRRVVAAIVGDAGQPSPQGEGIVIAAELTPADAAGLDPALVRAVATAHGTATAHAAILARALGLPAVVGIGEELLTLPEGTPLVLDGDRGELRVSPGAADEEAARARVADAEARRAAAREHAHEPAVTQDGQPVEVLANLDGPRDAALTVELGAEGVGLLRTEFMFLDGPELPSEDDQARALREVARALDGRPLTVRTLDVGADKPLPSLPQPHEHNPFLGRRGIRLSLAEPELLGSQLRAVLRVAAEHPLKLMFPMVATVDELRTALAALDAARAATGIDTAFEVGIMVEVPAAALLSEQFAAHVDFLSIGTNDLTQYTMAAERGNERVAALLEGPQPSVLRLVRETVDSARRDGVVVGVCGELAADPPAAVLLVGLGVRRLSLAPALVPEVKAALRSVALPAARAAAEHALAVERPDEARELAAALL
jgi:multiphosphoryl transfer protein